MEHTEQQWTFIKEHIRHGSMYLITSGSWTDERGVIMEVDAEGIQVYLPEQGETELIPWEQKTSIQPLLPEHDEVEKAVKELDDLTASLIDTGEEKYGYLISHYVDVLQAHLKK